MNRFFAFLALVGTTSPSAAFTTTKLSAAKPTAALMATPPRQEIKPIPADYVIPEGYVGGFAESEPQYSYPVERPDLDDIPIMDNLKNIDKLDRQQNVLWPEFSWLTDPGDETSRVYQRFAPNVSRLGYSNDGRVYSIICPQQGIHLPIIGNINIEVTVTGVRGWCKEPEKAFYADMGVVGKVWFGDPDNAPLIVKALEKIANWEKFPFSKDTAIEVQTHNRFEPWNPVFQVQNGTTTEYPIPQDRQHWDENAYGVGHIYVEIGKPKKTGNEKVDDLIDLIIGIFNLGYGNKLANGNVLSWNLWMAPPEIVDREEWANHAEYWRQSIDVKHEYPGGENLIDYVTDYEGNKYGPPQSLSQKISSLIHSYIAKWKNEKLDEFKENAIDTISHIHLFHLNREN
jgi:hypothetical protein